MLFSVALFSSLLLVPAVLAVPSPLGASVARRREGRRSQLNSRLEQTASDVSNTQYSGNWAGAILTEGDGTFNSVTGTFAVPTPSGSTGASAAVVVGIDGDTCTSAILEAFVVLNVSSNGQPEYSAWCVWYPEPSYGFSGIAISARDVIKLTVTAFTATSGEARIENLTNGDSAQKNLSSNAPLCGQNAEWLVEDYGVTTATDLVPFANFSTVTFTDAVAGTYTPSDGTLFDIEQYNQILTSTSASGSSITITYL